MRSPLRSLWPPVVVLAVLTTFWFLPESGPSPAESGAPLVPQTGHLPSAAVSGSTGNLTSSTGTPALPDNSPLPATAPSATDGPQPVRWTPGRPGAVPVPTTTDTLTRHLPGRSALLPPDFLASITAPDGQHVRFTLPDGADASGMVARSQSDEQGLLSVEGRLESPAPGWYFFQRQTASGAAGSLVGHVRFDDGGQAWRVDPSGPDGAPMLNAVPLDQVVCVGKQMPEETGDTGDGSELAGSPGPDGGSSADGITASGSPEEPGTPQFVPQTHPTNMAIPAELNNVIPLESLPGAAGVIYLDFDGEPGPFTGWGSVTGDAAPSGANNTQIKEVWQRVAEDYQAFNLNITTDRRVFDRAAETSRQHVIITPTKDAAPTAGGVAFIGSFDWSGNTVCWAFIRTGKNAAEVISHEVGHTLGLGHDGRITPDEDYYGGHGSGDVGWAPIMGVGYSENLTQWSRGEYASANNTQDDLSIIVNNNNSVDYRTDDTSATYATSRYLAILPNNSVSNEGIIETRADVDAWRFQSNGGAVTLTVATVALGPNVDLLAEIYNSADTLIASSNPDTTLGATVTATLAAGDYTFRVSGVGRGDPLTTGYTDYASIGAYLITGSVTNGVKADRFTLSENIPNGTSVGTVTPRLAHGTNSLTYSIASGNTGNAFALNPLNGQLTVATSAAINYETLSTRWDDPADFELFVTITDNTNAALTETKRVVVVVNPLNEAPVVSGGAVTMFTRTPAGVPVFKVSGSDPDRFDFPLFSIVSGNTGNAFAIDSVTGLLTTTANAPLTVPATPYSLTVRATDRASTPLVTDVTVTVSVLAAPTGYTPGGGTRTFYTGITGNAVSNLTGSAKFPNSPDREEVLNLLDEGESGSNYGSTLKAWILPPATGNYTFWITSDDASELRLSPNALPASAVVRASATAATGRYQYNKYTTQQSTTVALTAGQPYYMEARHKEGTGGDHLVIAWQGPGITRQPISGLHLVPYVQNYPPVIAAQTIVARRGSTNGTPLGTVNATDINTADALGSFTITGGTAAAWCAIDANTGLIFLTDAAALSAATGSSFTLTVRVSDDNISPLTGTGTVTLSVVNADAVRATGLTQQIWTGISGNTVSSLTGDARYPNSPTTSRTLTSFDTGEDYGENYGSRLRAWVVPPTTGSYIFYISGDDESQLRFTTGTNYATAPQIATAATATPRDTWTTLASQTSAAFTLTAGQRYYMEVRHKEGAVTDFVQVAWTGPGITTPTVIPGSALQPFDLNNAPVWSSAPYTFSVRQQAPSGTLIGNPSATDPDSSRLTYSIVSGNTGNAVALNPFTGALTVANRQSLVPGTPLTLTLRVQDDGFAGLYPFRAITTTATVNVTRDFLLVSPVNRQVNLPAGQGLELETLTSGRTGAVIGWSKVSGPGTVTFDDPANWTTGAAFLAPGLYNIRATETAAGTPLTIDVLVLAGAAPALPGGERIGTHTALSTHTWAAGSWQISAAGTGLPQGPADGVYFISQPAGTNVTITARVTGVQAISGHNSMAGLMIRESQAADARSFFCGVTSLNGTRILQRSTAGLPARASLSDNTNPATPFAPVWLRIIRSGNSFTTFSAPDVSGTPGPFAAMAPPVTLPFSNLALAGLAATSGVSGTRANAVIDNLTITPSLANLAPTVAVTAPAGSSVASPTTLAGSISDDSRPTAGSPLALWKKTAGPGVVTFANASAAATNATFPAPGTYQLRLTADDGEARTYQEVTLTVTASIDLWRTEKFGASATNPDLAGDLADPDKDGYVNLLEYLLAREPLTADAPNLSPGLVALDGNTYLRLTIARNPAAVDVTTVIETTSTPHMPGSWTTAGTVIEINTATTLRVRTAIPLAERPAQYLRVRVTR
jgi:hypothetical protein